MFKKRRMESIIGIGLVALDVVLDANSDRKPRLYAGGSCGNVLSILSYLGFDTYPIARLANNVATEKLLNDIKFWGVKTDLIFQGDDGSTPIIIQRNTISKDGLPVHKFEFRNPETGKFLPSFKPVLAKSIDDLFSKKSTCDFFYLDRVSRSAIDLAKLYKKNGAIVVFEPSSLKIENESLINEIQTFVDIIKFSNDRIPNYKSYFSKGLAPIEIETLGKDGINFRINNKVEKTDWYHLSSFNIENIIDSSGAGDWCTAGIIDCMISKKISTVNEIFFEEFKEILFYSEALAALSCLFKGARGMMYNIEKNTLNSLIEELILNNFNNLKELKNNTVDNNISNFESISSLLVL